MNELISQINNWGTLNVDKLLHFTIEAMLVTFLDLFMPLWFVIIIALVVGIGKEYLDLKLTGYWDLEDICADLIGIIVGIL